MLVIGAVFLTGDTPLPETAPVQQGGNASNLWELMEFGLKHYTNANIIGEGLESLKDDPSVQSAQDRLIETIKRYPNYGDQAFSISDNNSLHTSFTAGDVNGKWYLGAITGNSSFYMVHTAELDATNVSVSANGTISTTWEVVDNFDYLPAWDDHETRPKLANYLSYNLYATVVGGIYHGLLGAEQDLSTNAYWNEVIPPLENPTKPGMKELRY